MLYNGVLVSVYNKVNQLYIYMYISPYPLPLAYPSHSPYSTPLVDTKHGGDFPVLCIWFALAIYFTFGSVYMSMPLTHFIPAYPYPSPCPQVHLYVCVFIPVLTPGSSKPFFFFFEILYICVSIQYLFFSF